MRRQIRTQGFTIVELMVGALAGAVIAITVGTMLFYAYLAWSRHTNAVELQRDGSIAVDMITRKVRQVAVGDVSIGPGLLIISNNVGESQFAESGNDLVWDPDTTSGGDEYTVISGNLTEFTPSKMDNGIKVILDLQNNDERMKIDTVIAPRN